MIREILDSVRHQGMYALYEKARLSEDPVVWRMLARTQDPVIRSGLALNPYIDDDVRHILARDEDAFVRLAACGRLNGVM